MQRKVLVILVAAGASTRMNSVIKKPFIQIEGIPIIMYSLLKFESHRDVTDVIVVTSEENIHTVNQLTKKYSMKKVRSVLVGGEQRQASVKAGVDWIRHYLLSHHQLLLEEPLVLVHDAARPFITEDLISYCINAAYRSGAATLAVPVKDTIKRITRRVLSPTDAVEALFVAETLARKDLVQIQTPQGFRWSLLLEAHLTAIREGYEGTDDASLVEWLGNTVEITPGDYKNLKVTTPEDLLIAERFAAELGRGERQF